MKLPCLLRSMALVAMAVPAFAAQAQGGLLPGPLPASPTTFVAPRVVSAAALPASVSLTALMPPVMLQVTNNCISCSLSYGIMGYYARKYNWPQQDFSPAYIYNQVNGGVDLGSTFGDSVLVMFARGVCPLVSMPYNNSLAWPTQSQAQLAHPYRISTWDFPSVRKTSTFDPITPLKQLIVDGNPVALAIETEATWLALSGANATWTPPDSALATLNPTTDGHAVVICGYDDSRAAFLIQNSYGTTWGSAGRAWIPYALFSKAFIQPYAAVITPKREIPYVEVPFLLSGGARGYVDIQSKIPIPGSASTVDRYHYFKLYQETIYNLVDTTAGLQSSLIVSNEEMASWPPTPSRPWRFVITDRKIDGQAIFVNGMSLVRNGTEVVGADNYVSTMADGASLTITFTYTKLWSGASPNALILPYGLIGPASSIVISNAKQDYSSTQSTSVEAYEIIRIKPETTIRSEFRARIVAVPASG